MNAKLNSSDIAARLLATENITVVRARVRTASFDIKSRVLSLPQWKDMTPSIEGMLIGHEVGHALYTNEDYLKPIEVTPILRSYLNVLEDVRIEKLMKRKYPGIRKTMNEGYKELNERDFFGVSKIQDMNTLNLIDKINLYFKAGFSCGVQFSSEEKPFVVRAEKTETVQDVIDLAQDIYDFSKKVAEERKNSRIEDHDEDEDEDDYEERLFDDLEDEFSSSINIQDPEDDDEEDDDSTEEYEHSHTKNRARRNTSVRETLADVEEELESLTEKSFSENLDQSADESTEYVYHVLDENYQFDPIVPYKTVLAETTGVEDLLTGFDRERIQKFKEESTNVVNYLIKEFEMRKSAKMYKRSQTSKIGSLSMSKIWSYKLNDDLFKRVTVLPQGKNHGMIFLLDWSGSMDPFLSDTVKQVISLAMFCHRAQIPYQVFAFTTQYNVIDTHEFKSKMRDINSSFHTANSNVLSNASYQFALLELFSSKMTNVEFNNMIKRVFDFQYIRYSKNGQYTTGGTPLNEALAYMMIYLNKFIKSNNVEKMSLITLTDGQGGSLYAKNGRLEEYRFEYAPLYKKINIKNFLHDPVTKKNYSITRDGSSHTDAILRMMKDRYNINSVGFYLCSNSRRVLFDAVHNNVYGFNGSMESTIEQIRENFRTIGFSSLKNTGRDDLFIVPIGKMTVVEKEFDVSSDQSAKSIARSLTKHLNQKKTSRILLDRFIGYIA